jgi:thiol-disulfide isomerase/thioredoxin
MRYLKSIALYTALALGANAAAAADTAALSALAEGDMKKLNWHAAPQPSGSAAFQTVEGGEKTLADYAGKHVVLNFWATWCAPCRKEMPQLAELQAEFGGESFEVVTVATGRNAVPAMRNFFEEIGVDNLPLHRDPRQALAREMGVLGLPVTVILNPEGDEIARLTGDANWSSDSAKAIVAALVGAEG